MTEEAQTVQQVLGDVLAESNNLIAGSDTSAGFYDSWNQYSTSPYQQPSVYSSTSSSNYSTSYDGGYQSYYTPNYSTPASLFTTNSDYNQLINSFPTPPSTDSSSNASIGSSLVSVSELASTCASTPSISRSKKNKRVASKKLKEAQSQLSVLPSVPFEQQNITFELANHSLWKSFNALTTEMILTKTGRRMFPVLAFKVNGLDPNQKYNLFVDIVPADSNIWKYNGGKWISAGLSTSSAVKNRVYMHPESPQTGLAWMANEILFSKVKLSNHKSDADGHFLLNSFHRYVARVHIAPADATTNVKTFPFVDTQFIATTAYQNSQVTQLKIDYNPFAKGFRDNAERANENNMLIAASAHQRLPPASAEASISSPVPVNLPLYSAPVPASLNRGQYIQQATSTPKLLETQRYTSNVGNFSYNQWTAPSYSYFQSPVYPNYYVPDSVAEPSRNPKRSRSEDEDQENQLYSSQPAAKLYCTAPSDTLGFYPTESVVGNWS